MHAKIELSGVDLLIVECGFVNFIDGGLRVSCVPIIYIDAYRNTKHARFSFLIFKFKK